MNPERLPIKKYTDEELKAKIGEQVPAKLRLVKDGETGKIEETEEERRERFIRQTEVGMASQMKQKPENSQEGI